MEDEIIIEDDWIDPAERERDMKRPMTKYEEIEYAQAYEVIRIAKAVLSDSTERDQYHYYLRMIQGRIQVEQDQGGVFLRTG